MRQRIRARRMQAGRAGTPQAAREAPGCARAQGSCRRRARSARQRSHAPMPTKAYATPNSAPPRWPRWSSVRQRRNAPSASRPIMHGSSVPIAIGICRAAPPFNQRWTAVPGHARLSAAEPHEQRAALLFYRERGQASTYLSSTINTIQSHAHGEC
jgi:hypothetical protein